MFVKPEDIYDAAAASVAFHIVLVLITAYGFLCPLPSHVQVLIALGVTCVVAFLGVYEAAAKLRKKELEQTLWFYELTLRKALHAHAERLASERGAPRFDWEEATRAAVLDIKQAQDDHRLERRLSAIPVLFSAAVYVAGGLATIVPALVGWGIAWSIETYAPALAARIM
jgi:hypothetical protein